jgi:hypothetical protein
MVIYTNCGRPFNAPSELLFEGNIYGGGSQASYNAFEKTVYPITRSYCISCHSSIQPLHAADDLKTAHDAVISQFKVNFANIPASRLVAKLRDENHNCWGNCSENSLELQKAVELWNDAIKKSGVDATPKDLTIQTEESDTLEAEFLDSSNPLKTNTIKVNVAAAMLKAPMIRTSGDEGPYLWVPNNTNNVLSNNDANSGTAFMNFRAPATGQYQVWANANAPNTNDNSFYVNIRNGNNSVSGGTRQWDITVGTRFEWRRVSNFTMNLTKDVTYSMELRQREDGAMTSDFIITADTSFNGQEIGDYFGITLTFDLSSQLNTPGVKLLIDVIDYDPYSYKFSNPRIVSQNANVYVKGLKLLVNDIYSPQHSTYTWVDKIISPTNGLLSTNSMIVMKDQGMSGDRIKFTFDELAITTLDAGDGGGATGGNSGQTSLAAFQETMYPISRSSAYSCVGCHIAARAPFHASDSTLIAHDAALGIVDFVNPANSRIVRKMRDDRHNCGADCDQIANQYQDAIIEWRTKRQ